MRIRLTLLASTLALGVGALGATGARAGWDPLPPADLAAAPPASDPEADAAILLWNAYIDDDYVDFAVRDEERHFKRVKVFTPRGVERFGEVAIDYPERATVSDVAARTILPDGTVVEMKKDQAFDEVLRRNREGVVRERRFALPRVVPG